MKKKIGSGAAIGLAMLMLVDLEGLQTKPYKDIGGVLTVCMGETNIEMREYSKTECQAMLAQSVPRYYAQTMAEIKPEIPYTMQAAITSFSYNVGLAAFKRSTMLKKINAGDLVGACHELDRWVYVGRMRVQGLANRRAKEKEVCLMELGNAGANT